MRGPLGSRAAVGMDVVIVWTPDPHRKLMLLVPPPFLESASWMRAQAAAAFAGVLAERLWEGPGVGLLGLKVMLLMTADGIWWGVAGGRLGP